jgi:uncharacterized protein YeaO (DUF488 family)
MAKALKKKSAKKAGRAKNAAPATRKSSRRKPSGHKPSGHNARATSSIEIRRVYDAPEGSDCLRILIDRLWPRGIAKAKLKLDAWVMHLAPSNGLRKWYGHDPEKFAEFRKRYRAELASQREGLAELRSAVKGRRVTLLTATRELALSHAVVLRGLLT